MRRINSYPRRWTFFFCRLKSPPCPRRPFALSMDGSTLRAMPFRRTLRRGRDASSSFSFLLTSTSSFSARGTSFFFVDQQSFLCAVPSRSGMTVGRSLLKLPRFSATCRPSVFSGEIPPVSRPPAISFATACLRGYHRLRFFSSPTLVDVCMPLLPFLVQVPGRRAG